MPTPQEHLDQAAAIHCDELVKKEVELLKAQGVIEALVKQQVEEIVRQLTWKHKDDIAKVVSAKVLQAIQVNEDVLKGIVSEGVNDGLSELAERLTPYAW